MTSDPLQIIVEKTHADCAAIMMPDFKKNHLFCYASYRMPLEWTAITNSLDEEEPSSNAEVFRTGNTDIANHLCKTLKGFFIESVMIVPIYRGSSVIATLELIHNSDEKIFTKDDQQAAQAFTKAIEPEL